MLGVRRAGVTETAGELQRSGLVRLQQGKVTIINRDGFEAAAVGKGVRRDVDDRHDERTPAEFDLPPMADAPEIAFEPCHQTDPIDDEKSAIRYCACGGYAPSSPGFQHGLRSECRLKCVIWSYL